MDWFEILSGLKLIWDTKPGALVLLALGFIVFLFLVIDAWRLKRRRKRHH